MARAPLTVYSSDLCHPRRRRFRSPVPTSARGWLPDRESYRRRPSRSPVPTSASGWLPARESSSSCRSSPRIWLLSCGLESVDDQLTHLVRSTARRRWGDGVIAGLRRYSRRVDAVVDCCAFSDPNKWALVNLGHSGRRSKLMESILDNTQFHRWCREVNRIIQAQVASSSDCCIAYFCPCGKRRSVAAAEIVGELLLMDGSVDCRIERFACGTWPCQWNCRACG